MKKLELKKMEMVEGGGCSDRDNKALAVIGAAATVVGLFGGGLIGLALFGPTALGSAVGSLYCAFS